MRCPGCGGAPDIEVRKKGAKGCTCPYDCRCAWCEDDRNYYGFPVGKKKPEEKK